MSICLVMIVKNESRVIGRCLTSVRPYVNKFCIVDTGSTDETEKIIRLTLEDIPGEIYHRPWRDFASNRNEALELARWDPDKPRRNRTGDDYALVIDADDTLEVLRRDIKLTAPGYAIEVRNGDLRFWRSHIFKLDAGYVYRGVVHEVLVGPQPTKLEGIVYHCGGGGARGMNAREKFLRDAATLETVENPTPRDVYYLAQSWRDAGVLDKARDAYHRRVFEIPDREMFDEETFSAALEAAKLEERLDGGVAAVVEAYLTAHAIRPTRREALWHLARYAKSQASLIEKPDDALFIEAEVYAERRRKRDETFSVVVPEAPHSEAFDEIKLSLIKGLGDRYDISGTPIIVGPHRLREPPPRDAILYNFEQVATQSAGYERLLWLVQNSDCEVWDYSKANVAWWRKHGVLAKHVEVGYVPELARIPQADEDIDVLFYGAAHPRRRQILNELRERGLNVVAKFGVYGAERDVLIARSKVVLNVHYYEPGQFEISRVSYLLANKKCVVSETGIDDEYHAGVMFAEYAKLVDACESAATDSALRRRVAEEGFRLFSSRLQSDILKKCID